MNEIFRTADFAVEVIATGGFDDEVEPGKTYRIETKTLRLNHIALNEYIMAQVCNDRTTYENDQEWRDYLADKEKKRENFIRRVASAVGFPDDGVSVAQVVSEVFTVAHIYKKENTK